MNYFAKKDEELAQKNIHTWYIHTYPYFTLNHVSGVLEDGYHKGGVSTDSLRDTTGQQSSPLFDNMVDAQCVPHEGGFTEHWLVVAFQYVFYSTSTMLRKAVRYPPTGL